MKIFVRLIIALGCASPAVAGTLDALRPDHPRLLAVEQDFVRLGKLVKTDPLAKRWYGDLEDQAERMLEEPVATYNLRDGKRLKYESTDVLNRVLVLGLISKLEGGQRFRDRIWADLDAAAAFQDWNPAHFLDVAVMATAFAVAYDWLHDDWSPQQREVLRTALVRHAIKPGLVAYGQGAWWTRTTNNWNQVCNGGLILAALAVGDEVPDLSAQLMDRALQALPLSMNRYAPDGGYDEGPGYWAFGTLYNVLAIAALDSSLGTDFGLGNMPGVEATGAFPIHMTGPSGLAFNFGDGKERTPQSPTMFYFARRFAQPWYATFAAEHNAGGVLDLLWYSPALVAEDAGPIPLNAVYRVAGSMRSAWNDPEAWYVGLKAGSITHSHAQCDLGSFILESQGVRWLIDLGADDYNLPGYFDPDVARWGYYRNRAEGHNTLVINPRAEGPDQSRDADVAIEAQDELLRTDLSAAYPGRVTRSITLDLERDQVRVVDELRFDDAADVWWFAHTRATIELTDDGQIATLQQDGERLRASLVAPANARFRVMAARPLPTSPSPEGQNPNDGSTILNASPGAHFVRRGEQPRFGAPNPSRAIRKLAIHVDGVTNGRIEVSFENVNDDAGIPAARSSRPLPWAGQGGGIVRSNLHRVAEPALAR